MTTTVPEALRAFSAANHWSMRRTATGWIFLAPFTLDGSTGLVLSIDQEGEMVRISDDGQVADYLEIQGVDVTAGVSAKSWFSIVRGLSHPRPIEGVADWELAVECSLDALGPALISVSEASIRAAALSFMARSRKARSYGEEVVQTIGQRVTIEPRAAVPTIAGPGRRVTLRLVDSGMYVQATSGRNREARRQSYDHTRSIWADARVRSDQKVSVLEGAKRDWEEWQVAGLAAAGAVTDSEDLPSFLDRLQGDPLPA